MFAYVISTFCMGGASGLTHHWVIPPPTSCLGFCLLFMRPSSLPPHSLVLAYSTSSLSLLSFRGDWRVVVVLVGHSVVTEVWGLSRSALVGGMELPCLLCLQ